MLFPKGFSEFWPTARDTFSSNRETYLSWQADFFKGLKTEHLRLKYPFDLAFYSWTPVILYAAKYNQGFA